MQSKPVEASSRIVTASWYGPGFHGNQMANGETFNMNDKTIVAHKELEFGTKVTLLNPDNGKTLTVEVKDRGPFIDGRDFDLSKAAARVLGTIEQGVATLVVLKVIEP